MHFKAEGTAFLCFLEDGSAFQGVFTSESGDNYSLAGTAGSLPPGNFHECCFDTMPTFYNIEIVQSEGCELVTKLYNINHVMKLGGDNCRLCYDDHFEFNTDKLLVGQKAEEFIVKYFPPRFLGHQCYICIGEMSIDYVFPDITLDEPVE